MNVAKINAISFRSSEPTIAKNTSTPPTPNAEKNDDSRIETVLMIGGGALALAILGYAIYRHKSPKAVKEITGDATNKTKKAVTRSTHRSSQPSTEAKHAHKSVKSTIDNIAKDNKSLKIFWAQNPIKPENIGKKVKVKSGFTIHTIKVIAKGGEETKTVQRAYRKDRLISINEISSDGKTYSTYAFDTNGRLTRYFGKEKRTRFSLEVSRGKNGKITSYITRSWINGEKKIQSYKVIKDASGKTTGCKCTGDGVGFEFATIYNKKNEPIKATLSGSGQTEEFLNNSTTPREFRTAIKRVNNMCTYYESHYEREAKAIEIMLK